MAPAVGLPPRAGTSEIAGLDLHSRFLGNRFRPNRWCPEVAPAHSPQKLGHWFDPLLAAGWGSKPPGLGSSRSSGLGSSHARSERPTAEVHIGSVHPERDFERWLGERRTGGADVVGPAIERRAQVVARNGPRGGGGGG